jgi:Concanavalin A-like lectin/glucanases superfamily/Neutral/alkaline non-lysosomal ceramidase, N-terminal
MRSLLQLSGLAFALISTCVEPARAEFKAGAAVIDVTPVKLPVLLNGGMTSRFSDKVKTHVNARAIALADEKEQCVIVVVDSCSMGRPLLDEVKALAEKRTGIPANRILISATHAHSAPSAMAALGTEADPEYVPFLRQKLVQAIVAAQAALEPARIGFAKGNAADYTALRQWIRRPDRLEEDPFGNMTGRANMHAGRIWDNVTGEAGPKDPDLSLISIQARDGRPLAVLGNFSMHYFTDKDISADYYGLFSEGLKQRIAPEAAPGKPAFVGAMSHGCSGDIWRRDYTKPESEWNAKLTIEDYTSGLLDIAMKAYQGIRYRDDVDLTMVERRVPMNYRVPDKQRLEWAQRVVAGLGDRPAKTQSEVYAREQIFLDQWQKTEVVVQALRIGDIGIATSPCETYAVTGLKIKAASPLPQTIVIELANGSDGYIPPPEQHLFGGYNTWAARTAGLEVTAEPKIAETAIELLENVSGQPRREWKLSDGSAARAILDAKPAAYWRLNEFTGPRAADASGHGRDAIYEPAITYYLEGPRSAGFCAQGELNRAPMFVGGRLRAELDGLADHYSISMWLWNGMPNDGREVSGWFFSRGADHGLDAHGDHLGIGGKSAHTGRLIFFHGDDAKTAVAGQSEIPRWQWQHVVLVRDGGNVRVYLNGNLDLETKAPAGALASLRQCFFGGRSDNDSNWEGRLDEIAVFDRALSAEDVTKLDVK